MHEVLFAPYLHIFAPYLNYCKDHRCSDSSDEWCVKWRSQLQQPLTASSRECPKWKLDIPSPSFSKLTWKFHKADWAAFSHLWNSTLSHAGPNATGDQNSSLSWRTCTVIPIPKLLKDVSDSNNYRRIAIISCLCKVMERMVNNNVWLTIELFGF